MPTPWTLSTWCSVLFDGDWLELRNSPAGAISRSAYGHPRRAGKLVEVYVGYS